MFRAHVAAVVVLLLSPVVAFGEPEPAPPPAEEAYLAIKDMVREGRPEDALRAIETFLVTYHGGGGLDKIEFLKAAALVELRRFEEAAKVYEVAAEGLLGPNRKDEIARRILEIADALAADPDPSDPGAPKPDHGKAHTLYRKVLELGIGRDLEDEVRLRSALAIFRAGNPSRAVAELHEYLRAFDPAWSGPVGSPERAAGILRENPPPGGKHVHRARYLLAEAQIALGGHAAARRNLEDLLELAGKDAAILPDARWLLLATYRLPKPSVGELEAGLRAARAFLASHPADPRAAVVAWGMAESAQHHGRSDQAVKLFGRFVDRTDFRLPEGELRDAPIEGVGKSPVEWIDERTKLAVHRVGAIRFAQRRFEEAIEAFHGYVARYPDGPQWSAAQKGIIDARFEMAIDAVANGKADDARADLEGFLRSYPLDGRAPRILFLLGQLHATRADRLAAPGDEVAIPAEEIREAYEAAIADWTRLVGKYPRTEESSLALYRIGLIREERFGEPEEALATYRRLTWGSWGGHARARIALLTRKQLSLETERVFRTNEIARVKVRLRNVETLTVKRYALDLEAYFRKTHGAGGVESLDVALIQPDETWEIEVEGYRPHAPLVRDVEIPFDEDRPGVSLVTVSDGEREATTLVLRTDLDLIVRSGRREALVFAQDRRADAPAAGVRVLLSDGETVFSTGETGEDGVLRVDLAGRDVKSLRVFADRNGHVAAHALDLSGLPAPTGLSPRGYVYTDRPAYRPGQQVGIRGIVRDVVDGSYATPAGRAVEVTVTDPRGRVIHRVERTLSAFGTFEASLPLAPVAPVGTYGIAAAPKGAAGRTYAGTFRVAEFQLEKMRLEIEVPRGAYLRGETVEATIRATYAWGEPVAGRQVRVGLPDGRVLVRTTDARGETKVSVDTTGMTPGSVLPFSARIEGENVAAIARVVLARLGFGLAVRSVQDVALSGAPFDVVVTAKTAGGEPAERDLVLSVLRRVAVPTHPALDAVPWIRRPAPPAAEVTVAEHRIRTDAKGEAKLRLALEKGGRYVLRASGQDRLGQVVVTEGAVTVSDETDTTRLRFFAEADTVPVGGKATIRLHSRLPERLALLTFDGETVLEHRVVRLATGMNEVDLVVGHEHFPNFRVTAAVIDGRELRTAERPFRVERRLRVTVRPLEPIAAPGTPGRVEITAVDQLGNPVRAELSLALVDDALFGLFPDRTPPILDFFQKGTAREAAFRVAATCGFAYAGETRLVDAAIREERARQELSQQEEVLLGELRDELRTARGVRVAGRARAPGGGGAPPPPAASPRPRNGLAADREAAASKAMEKADAAPAPVREEIPGAGWWLPTVTTGEDGKAVVEATLPETTSRWRLTARGVTVETLVGEARAELVTRKDFFVEVKAPAFLRENDRIRVLARIHDRVGSEDPVDVVLRVRRPDQDGALIERVAKTATRKGEPAEVLFEALAVPAVEGLVLEVEARSGDRRDAVRRAVPVRPWGLEMADHAGGVARADAAAKLRLPATRETTSRWLTVTVGPSLERALVAMALDEPVRRLRPVRWGGHAGSDLIATASVLEYARRVKAPAADVARLSDRARALVASLALSQRPDGAWSWTIGRANADLATTARAAWGLAAARRLGLSVDAKVVQAARDWLKSTYGSLPANAHDRKAVVVHVLAELGEADFAHVNRLYRERTALTTSALSRTALALVRMGPEGARGRGCWTSSTRRRSARAGIRRRRSTGRARPGSTRTSTVTT
jgi:tetratricopeptide (TPR) repeat protein